MKTNIVYDICLNDTEITYFKYIAKTYVGYGEMLCTNKNGHPMSF